MNVAREVTPRVLLLEEGQATGGVVTISNILRGALQQQNWSVNVLPLNLCGWRERLAAARDCDVLLASHNFRPAYVAWALSRLSRKPVVVWVHGPLQEVLTQARASSLKRGWLRWLYGRVSKLVFVSRTSRDSFDRFMKKPLRSHQRSIVIPNAVALHESAADALPPEDEVPLNLQLAYIGRLSPEKQPALLLDMLRQLPSHFSLTLIGDGPLRGQLQQVGNDLITCGRLTFAGTQPHSAYLYAPWHVTLLASLYEGCPMTLLESLAAGIPCVSLPIPAIQEIIGDDAPYLLAHDHSAQALAAAVQAVRKLPQDQVRADMACVLSRHQMRDFVERWQAVLQEAAKSC